MPLVSEVHINAAMTQFSLRYSPGTMIADKVLPPITVKKESDYYFTYDKDNLRNDADGPRAPRDPASEVDYGLSSTTYSLDFYSFKELVTDRERDNADDVLDPEMDAVQNLMDRILIGKEIRAAGQVFSSTYLTTGTTLSGTDQWSDPANSDPLGDIETALDSVHGYSRKDDTEMSVIMGIAVWRKVRHHPSIVARFQYTSGGRVTRAQFADLVGIKPENLLIGAAGYNSADEGQTSATMADIWGKHFVVAYIDRNPRPRSLTLGATFQRKGNVVVTSWREDDPAGEWEKVEMGYDQVIIAADCGYLITNAIA